MFLKELSDYSLQGLRVFTHVASLGSVAEAASALGLTQPAVSLQINNLEKQIGIALFERQGRKNVLTAQGQSLLQKILPELERLERILSDARAQENVIQRKLFIGSVEGIGEYWLGPRLNRFHAKNEDSRFLLEICETDVLEEKLLTGQLSLIITTRKIENERVVSQMLVDERLSPVAKPELIEQLGAAIRSAQEKERFWESFNWIGYGDSDHFDPWTLRWLENIGAHVDRRFKYIHRVNSYPVIKDFLNEGMGLCVAPVHTCEKELEEGRLAVLESAEFPALKNRLYVAFREDSLNATHEVFKNWLLEIAKEY